MESKKQSKKQKQAAAAAAKKEEKPAEKEVVVEEQKAEKKEEKSAKESTPVKEEKVKPSKGWGDVSSTPGEEQKMPTLEEQRKMQSAHFINYTRKRLEEDRQQGKLGWGERKKLLQQMKIVAPHKFWDDQPVWKMFQPQPKRDGPVMTQALSDVKTDAGPLPEGFEWVTLDISLPDEMQKLYELLRDHYVEDDDNKFRFDYPVEFLKWTLCIPNYKSAWHLGIQSTKDKKLLAFISGTPIKTQVNENNVKMAEINFLCIHKKLRTKRLAPVMVKEITRRVNLCKVWQAYFTSGTAFPTPFSSSPYFHRGLNIKKNIQTGFSYLPKGKSLAKHCKEQALLDDEFIYGTPRLMEKKDVPAVFALYCKQQEKYQVKFKYSQQEIAHILMPREDVITTLVFCNVETGVVTDFVSFYNLPSQILTQDGHNHTLMKVAYLFYYGVGEQNKLEDLMKYTLQYAKKDGYDVFNCLLIQDNNTFLKNLGFSQGDGILNFYMYNWQVQSVNISPLKIGTVLV